MADENEEKSVGWVALMAASVIAYIGWACLSADYFQHGSTDGPQETNFWINSIVQIPNCFSVLSYAIDNRLWAVILIAALEVGVFFGWLGLRKLEKQLNTRGRKR